MDSTAPAGAALLLDFIASVVAAAAPLIQLELARVDVGLRIDAAPDQPAVLQVLVAKGITL